MRQYVVKRILISIVIFFFVALIIYSLMRSLPQSFIDQMARERTATDTTRTFDEVKAELIELYSMDKGILEGYFKWLSEAVRGEFGVSWEFGIPVLEKFNSCIWYSVALGAVSFILELIVAVPLGITAAVNQYSRRDYAITVFALVGISLPSFFFATLLKYFFAGRLHWFEPYGMVSRNYPNLTTWGRFWDMAHHFVLPILTLLIISIGGLMRYTRTNMLEVLNADYIRTARAKGLSEKKVINKHAFRNTLIPLVTIIGGSLPSLFAGAMITEQLFAIEGIGYHSYNAMQKGDIPFSMFYMCFMAILTLLGNLISDVLYAVVDPRVRLS